MRGMGHREALLAAARTCMADRGYARTTARDLVAASGTNLASIGYHFGSKEALLNAAIAESFEDWLGRIRELVLAEGPLDPLDALRKGWAALEQILAEHRALAVAFVEALAQCERSPALRRQLADCYEHLRTRVGETVTEFVGELPEHTVRSVASFNIAVCDGLLLQWLIDPDRAPSAGNLVDGMLTVAGSTASPSRQP
jgi:AcrR family transcriptional regulator